MTAGRLSSPQRRPAVIARPSIASPSIALPSIALPSIAHAPLASLTGSVLGPRFHAWYGRSKRRTICSVYPVCDSGEAKGPPDFADGIVIAARRDGTWLSAIAVFELGDGEDRRRRIDEAISRGATEWHVHLLAVDGKERQALLRDLAGL
jgi:hypothetical protein